MCVTGRFAGNKITFFELVLEKVADTSPLAAILIFPPLLSIESGTKLSEKKG